jgi:hypothetical protein
MGITWPYLLLLGNPTHSTSVLSHRSRLQAEKAAQKRQGRVDSSLDMQAPKGGEWVEEEVFLLDLSQNNSLWFMRISQSGVTELLPHPGEYSGSPSWTENWEADITVSSAEFICPSHKNLQTAHRLWIAPDRPQYEAVLSFYCFPQHC